MPVTKIRGINQHYEIIGETGLWVALSPGGRTPMGEIRDMAVQLSAKGYRVLIFDRRNCGKTDIGITGGDAEYTEWADDLFELTKQLNAQPCIVGGASSGCRTSVSFAIKYPKAVTGLLLWKMSAGPYATLNLGVRYYSEYIKIAGLKGMEGICKTDFFAKRISENPRNKDILMKMDPNKFVDVMTRWMVTFISCSNFPLIGATEDQLKNITVPTLLFCGNDRHHSREASFGTHELIPESELVDLGMPVLDIDAQSAEEYGKYTPKMVEKFDEFIKRRI